jgi:hypothetical protein
MASVLTVKLFDKSGLFWPAQVMLRQIRREFAGAIHHGINRGDCRLASGPEKGYKESADGSAVEKGNDDESEWIAQHLAMGSWTHVSNLLGAQRKLETLKRVTLARSPR